MENTINVHRNSKSMRSVCREARLICIGFTTASGQQNASMCDAKTNKSAKISTLDVALLKSLPFEFIRYLIFHLSIHLYNIRVTMNVPLIDSSSLYHSIPGDKIAIDLSRLRDRLADNRSK